MRRAWLRVTIAVRTRRRQGNRWAAQAQQRYEAQAYAPPPAPAPAPAAPETDRITALRELGELKAQGVLTEAEFAAEKPRLLGS